MLGNKSSLLTLLLLPSLVLANNIWTVTFHGIADEKYPEVLSIGDKQDSAKGVSIALFDNEDRLIPLNSTPINWNRLYKGPKTLNFVAKYRATSNVVTGGIAKAHAWFALTYQ